MRAPSAVRHLRGCALERCDEQLDTPPTLEAVLLPVLCMRRRVIHVARPTLFASAPQKLACFVSCLLIDGERPPARQTDTTGQHGDMSGQAWTGMCSQRRDVRDPPHKTRSLLDLRGGSASRVATGPRPSGGGAEKRREREQKIGGFESPRKARAPVPVPSPRRSSKHLCYPRRCVRCGAVRCSADAGHHVRWLPGSNDRLCSVRGADSLGRLLLALPAACRRGRRLSVKGTR